MAASDAAVTSPRTDDYNCIAWAAGDSANFWWPVEVAHWPISPPPSDASIETFVAAFRTLGYEPCPDGSHESGREKVAIYFGAGEVQHMARQLENGRWTSKLGPNVDIEHELAALEGGLYGRVVAFLARARREP